MKNINTTSKAPTTYEKRDGAGTRNTSSDSASKLTIKKPPRPQK